jgi:hypothetical protein
MDPEAVDRERARRRQRAEQVQRRRLALGVVALGLVVLVVALAIGLSGGDDTVTTTTPSTDGTGGTLVSGTYGAELTGDDSVPPVQTAATGNLILTYDAETNEMSFVLEITHVLSNPTGATIYEGAPGTEDGAAVYTLYVADQAEEGTFSGILAEAIINEADLIGPLQGGTIADLIQLIEDGNAYVSVANKTHPVDAIRGPIN